MGEWFSLFQGIVLPSSLGSHSPGLLDPEDEGTVTLHMSGTTYPVTQCHLPVDVNPQQHWCENLKSRVIEITERGRKIFLALCTGALTYTLMHSLLSR